MSIWSIEHNSTLYTFSDLNLSEPVFTFRADGQDFCSIHKSDTNIDVDPIFNHADTLSIYKQNVRWFEGTVTQIPRKGHAGEESHRFIIRNAWHSLENIVFQQAWQFADDPEDPNSTLTQAHISQIILNQDENGNKTDIGTQLNEILDYAISRGANLQKGSINLSFTVPWEEYADITCAEAIKKLLKWAPDAVLWFDYSTPVPTLHIQPANALTTHTLELPAANNTGTNAVPLENIELIPRYDLQVPEVYLRYVFENETNGVRWRKLVIDAYPPTANGEAQGALNKTLELRGSISKSKRVRLKQTIESIPLGNIGSLDFWKQSFPQLRDVNPSDITIESPVREGNTALDRILTKGSITDWMEEQYDHIAEKQRVTCKVGPFNRQIDGNLPQDIFHYTLETHILATNALSDTYKYDELKKAEYTPPEPVPVGLAQHLFEALNPLRWEGTISLIEREVSGNIRPGMRLNISEARSEWATMQSMVQEVVEEANEGRTRIRLGVNRTLSAEGLLSLLRLDQDPLKRYSFRARNSAKEDPDDEINEQALGKHHPIEPSSIPDVPQHKRLVIQDPKAPINDPARVVVIDVNDMPTALNVGSDIILKLQEIPIAAIDANGYPQLEYATVLISDPYPHI